MSKDNVLPFIRQKCPCGWSPPVKLKVDGIYGFQAADLKVYFNCPECDRTLEMLMSTKVDDETVDDV